MDPPITPALPSTTTTSSHRRNCTEAETEEADCLHGTCFSTAFGSPRCSCDEGYDGVRCENMEIPDVFGIKSRTAMKIGISAVVVFSIAVIILLVILYIRYRRIKQASNIKPLTNSEESLDNDADQPRPAPKPDPEQQPKSSLDVKFLRATDSNPHQRLHPPENQVRKAPSRERLKAVTSETLHDDEPATNDACGDKVVIVNTTS